MPTTSQSAKPPYNNQKRATPANACRNCPYLFQSVWIYFADSVCTAIDLPSASRISGCLSLVSWLQDFFACSKDNTLSIQKTGSPCECLQELPVSVLICLDFTLPILSARQLACPLHPEFPAACPLSHIPWSQRLSSPAPKTARRTWSVPKCFP